MSSPHVSVTGTFQGRTVTLRWDRGRISGTDPDALDDLAFRGCVYGGERLKLWPTYCPRATLFTPAGFALLACGVLSDDGKTAPQIEGLNYPPIPDGAIS